MNIYQLSQKELKKEMKKFYKTAYGKIVFCLAYSVPIISFLLMIALMIPLFFCSCGIWGLWCYGPIFMALLFMTLISFILGSIYYYHKLETFIQSKSK